MRPAWSAHNGSRGTAEPNSSCQDDRRDCGGNFEAPVWTRRPAVKHEAGGPWQCLAKGGLAFVSPAPSRLTIGLAAVVWWCGGVVVWWWC